MVARLAELKSQLADGKLTREEFEVLEQEALQASGTDRGSDRGSDCASERSASPAPVIGGPVYGAATRSAVLGTHGNSTHLGGMVTTDPFAAPHDNDPNQLIAERLSRARVSVASAASRRLSPPDETSEHAERVSVKGGTRCGSDAVHH